MAQSTHSGHSTEAFRSPFVLNQAAQSLFQSEVERPDAQSVVEALVKTEQEIKTTRTPLPTDSLIGSWRLYFTASKKSLLHSGKVEGSGRYVPGFIKAHLMFSPKTEKGENESARPQPLSTADSSTHAIASTQLAIANQLQLGAIVIRLTGPAKYLDRKRLLAFDFTQMELRLFGLRLYHGSFPGRRSNPDSFHEQSIAHLPFFAFIGATEHFIAARGRGGGLALWVSDRHLTEQESSTHHLAS